MKSKFKQGDRVIIRKTGQKATIMVCCGGNIFLPQCLTIPAYFILINGENDTTWVKQTKIKADNV